MDLVEIWNINILGIPDGGSGGNGGDVYFRSTGRINSLYDLRRAHFKGNNGKSGKVSDKSISFRHVMLFL